MNSIAPDHAKDIPVESMCKDLTQALDRLRLETMEFRPNTGWPEDQAELKTLLASVENSVELLQGIHRKLRRFVHAVELVQGAGPEGAISLIESSLGDMPSAEVRNESTALVLAVSQGVTLGQFLESDSAVSALEQFGNTAQREDHKP